MRDQSSHQPPHTLRSSVGKTILYDMPLSAVRATAPFPLQRNEPTTLIAGTALSGRAVDMWAAGVVLAELLLGREWIFIRDRNMHGMDAICNFIGKPTESDIDRQPVRCVGLVRVRSANWHRACS
jgi:serine/threonine protein kinase